MITGVVSSELMNTLEEKLARETLMHGVFLNIHGKGVIIKGDSGIGKSEKMCIRDSDDCYWNAYWRNGFKEYFCRKENIFNFFI